MKQFSFLELHPFFREKTVVTKLVCRYTMKTEPSCIRYSFDDEKTIRQIFIPIDENGRLSTKYLIYNDQYRTYVKAQNIPEWFTYLTAICALKVKNKHRLSYLFEKKPVGSFASKLN